ncbi:A24 family peptidase [Natrarchaeobaculum aegyptiacum]|uniref:Peptidase A24 n=1 Tax=Natrarchaeobaculum aegyptiacum TaxID=745377 RepID=A0A2Z2HRW6_9EURY|nr:A24 family peptidase [Natrarchaeobaculum aegyptiacum]ARS89839.1 peptidase A24 [Natrarchaeobaculum aegyptiacum]
MTLAFASTPDLLRLIALPVFAWIAVLDIRTRRVSSDVWIPLALLGGVLLVWDGWLAQNAGGTVWTHEFLLPAAISVGFVVPIAYLFWWVGGFGGADAKALMVLALLFPTIPQYAVGGVTLPASPPPIGAFSFTILTNAVLVGILIPVALALRNALAGRVGLVSFVGWPINVDRIPTTHGRLLERTDGVSRGRGGLDLDALRMYLRWRGLTLEDVREAPDTYRNPATLPEEPNPPTDGAVTADVRHDGGEALESNHTESEDADYDDPWGADAFLEDIDHTAYGTTPEELREGLEVLTTSERVWISPGTPFLVPVFAGMVVAFTYGDLLVGILL